MGDQKLKVPNIPTFHLFQVPCFGRMQSQRYGTGGRDWGIHPLKIAAIYRPRSRIGDVIAGARLRLFCAGDAVA